MITAKIAEGKSKIELRSRWELREAAKSVPGARWNPNRKCWVYPATPAVAQQLIASMREAAPGEEIDMDSEIAILLEAYSTGRAAQTIKSVNELADWGSPTAAWTHQRQAYHFARAQKAALLAMDMGTGKTKVAVGLIEAWGAKKVLVICPRSVLTVWPEQVKQHAQINNWSVVPLRDGSVASRADELDQAIAQHARLIVLVNYEAAWRSPLGERILAREWDTVILDESHRIKAPGGKASIFCARLRDRAKRRLCLTGTPMPHSPLDIYAQYRFLEPGIYGTSFARFRQHYAVMGGYEDRQVVGWQNREELSERMGMIAYHCEKNDVLDLPEYQHVARKCTLGAEAQRSYDELRKQFIAVLNESEYIDAPNTLTQLLRFSQIANGWVATKEHGGQGKTALRTVGTEKLDLLSDVLDDIAPDEPLVIFTRFHRDMDLIHERLSEHGRKTLELSGRRNDLEAWQKGNAPVLLVQPKAGGVGIDLSRAAIAIYYSVDWSLGDYDQSLSRLHRPGQKRSVLYMHLVTENTVDEVIYRALRGRRNLIDAVIEQMRSA